MYIPYEYTYMFLINLTNCIDFGRFVFIIIFGLLIF